MATYPADLRYTKEHEWAKVDGARARVGITHFAQDQLGDVVFVELPKVGAQVRAMQTFGVVESVKAVSDLFAPLSGRVVEVNESLVNRGMEVVGSPPEAFAEFLKRESEASGRLIKSAGIKIE